MHGFLNKVFSTVFLNKQSVSNPCNPCSNKTNKQNEIQIKYQLPKLRSKSKKYT
ncbi:hypothetical protein MCERE19_03611 [Spirosomataceae bacterium]